MGKIKNQLEKLIMESDDKEIAVLEALLVINRAMDELIEHDVKTHENQTPYSTCETPR